MLHHAQEMERMGRSNVMPPNHEPPLICRFTDASSSDSRFADAKMGVRLQNRIIIQNLAILTRPADVALLSLHRGFRETQTLLERRRPMTMIKQILKAKGRGYVSVSPNETVYSAIEKMAEKNICLLYTSDAADE